MSLPSLIGNGNYNDENVLRYVLSGFLPGSFGKDEADMSGMDCFVAVIRHICSLVDRDLMDLVASNDALKFVMADFEADTEEKRKKVQEYRVATFKKVEQLVGKEKPSFEDIVESEAVRKNFWVYYGCILFQPLVYRDELAERWHCKEDDSMFAAAHSLVHWSLQDYATVQDVLTETKFGTSRLSSKQEVRFTFGKPAVVRVRFASKVNRETWQGGNFSIRDVQCFSYDVVTRKTIWNAAEGITTVKETASHKPRDRLLYCLIAVVRLRKPGEHHDYARLYDFDSQHILPHGDQQYFDTFENDVWSIGNLDHDFMLYYARADGRLVSDDCIRRCVEVGNRWPDPDCVRRGERILDARWQTTHEDMKMTEPKLPVWDEVMDDEQPPEENRPFR